MLETPWRVIEGNNKKRARLKCIHHLLQQIPYNEIDHEPVIQLPRKPNADYERRPVPGNMIFSEVC
jgi:hypothetical protein